MDGVQLSQGYRAIARRHLFFTTQSSGVSRTHLINLIQSFNQWDERLQ